MFSQLPQVAGVALGVTWYDLDVLHIFTDSGRMVGKDGGLCQQPSEAQMVLRAWNPPQHPHTHSYLHHYQEDRPAGPGTTQGTTGYRRMATRENRGLDQAEGSLCPPKSSSGASGSQATQPRASFPKWGGKDPAWDGFQG